MLISRYPPTSEEPGICLAIGCMVVIAALLAAAGLESDRNRTLVLLLLVVAATSLRTTVAVGAAIGSLGWGLYTGFVLHRYGVLTVGGPDLARATVLVATGALTAACTGHHRPVPVDDRRT